MRTQGGSVLDRPPTDHGGEVGGFDGSGDPSDWEAWSAQIGRRPGADEGYRVVDVGRKMFLGANALTGAFANAFRTDRVMPVHYSSVPRLGAMTLHAEAG